MQKYLLNSIEDETPFNAVYWEATMDSWNEIKELPNIDISPGPIGSRSFFIKNNKSILHVECGRYVVNKNGIFFTMSKEQFELNFKEINADIA